MRKIIIVFLFMTLVSLSLRAFAYEKRVYSCYRLANEPVLDGKLKDDPAWGNIPEETGFIKFSTTSLASKQTSFRIGYTPEALFIGVECDEPEMKKIKAELKHMGPLWTEDSIEIFIFPKDSDNYYHFIVNVIGSRLNGIRNKQCEKIGAQPLWNWQAKTYKGEDYYSIEIEIPFEVFLAIPEENEVWTGTICRNIYTTSGDKYTSWGYVRYGFHEPYNFGKLIFKDTISPEEGKKTNNRIIGSLRKRILINLGLLSPLKKEFSKAAKKTPAITKEVSIFLDNCKEIKEGLSKLNSVKEAKFLLKRSGNLLEEAKKLEAKVLLENLFEE